MSWDADLIDDATGDQVYWTNYTHNVNVMADLVLYPNMEARTRSAMYRENPQLLTWWEQLDGKAGRDGAEFLDRIIEGLRTAPGRFRVLNPENGWGDYDRFVARLEEMRDAVPETIATTWRVSG